MASKKTNSKKIASSIPARTVAPVQAVAPMATTPVRNTAIPKAVVAPARREITHDQIARRAYEIYASGTGGSADQNWQRAERELKGL